MFTVKVNCWIWVAPAVTGWKPESIPLVPSALVMRSHGLAKVDWVTEWFFERNWNETLSPFAMVMLEDDCGSVQKCCLETREKLFEGLPGRVEGQCTVLAHLDDEVLALSESHADEGEGSEDSRETHLGLI